MESAAASTVPDGDPVWRRLLALLKTAARKWIADRAPQMGAALAYYAAFSIAPLLIVAVSVAGLAAGDQAVEGEIVTQLEDTLGEDTASFVEGMVERARGGGGVGGTILGLAIGFFAASTLAVNLRRMLNAIWAVPREEQSGLRAAIRTRAAGLAVVGGAALVVLAAMAASAALATIGDIGSGPWLRMLLEVANFVAGIALTALAFAALFRFLPATGVGWREALLGGTVAAVLFTVASWALARYIGSGAVGRGFGAAAALIVLLVFVYYSAQILLYGAELAAVAGRAEQAPAEQPAPARVPAGESTTPPSRTGAFALGLLLGAWARRRSQ